jgi:hypothetical protein
LTEGGPGLSPPPPGDVAQSPGKHTFLRCSTLSSCNNFTSDLAWCCLFLALALTSSPIVLVSGCFNCHFDIYIIRTTTTSIYRVSELQCTSFPRARRPNSPTRPMMYGQRLGRDHWQLCGLRASGRWYAENSLVKAFSLRSRMAIQNAPGGM